MPNIKSSKKDVLSSKIAYEKNKADKSELKTNLKKFDAALVAGDKTVAEAAYKTAVKSVDQAVIKGLLHKNNAARKKSSMTLKLNKLGNSSLKSKTKVVSLLLLKQVKFKKL